MSGGNSGGVGGFGGVSYGSSNLIGMEAGSGGGGGSGGYSCGSGGGGAGGGFIKITSGGTITIGTSGSINTNGGNGGSDGTGNCGGGGGGSGGAIFLQAVNISKGGSLFSNGGLGGPSQVSYSPYFGEGANGSEGRIYLEYGFSYMETGINQPEPLAQQQSCNKVKNQFTNISYSSLHDAINDANPMAIDTLIFLDNVEESFIAYNSVVLKGNGFTLTIPDEIPDVEFGKMEIDANKTVTWLEGNLIVNPLGIIINGGILHNKGTIIYNNIDGFSNDGIYKGSGVFQGNFINYGIVDVGN